MGLHQDIPEEYFPDKASREHCVRIWWTAYILDRLWTSKSKRQARTPYYPFFLDTSMRERLIVQIIVNHPVSIQDEDVAVRFPSNDNISSSDSGDFFDAEHMSASIKLARISRDIIASIYNRRTTNITFSRRVQKALGDLRGWVSELPKHLQIETGETAKPLMRHVKWLHLSFNQVGFQIQLRYILPLCSLLTTIHIVRDSGYTAHSPTRFPSARRALV